MQLLPKDYFVGVDYPIEHLWQLFTYDGRFAATREFAFFTEKRTDGTEICIRPLTFASPKEFLVQIKALRPYRIEVGAIYLVAPSPRQPCPCSSIILRELTVDMDMDDLDRPVSKAVRSCCSGRDFCPACWPLLSLAAIVVDERIAHLGCEHRAWFYTGGRGLHCFTFSHGHPLLRDSSSEVRRALCEFIGSVNCASDTNTNRMGLAQYFVNWYAPRHPNIAIVALNQAQPGFAHVDASALQETCVLLAALRASNRETAPHSDSSIEDLPLDNVSVIHVGAVLRTLRDQTQAEAVVAAAYACLAPRIDKNVTLQPRHLLRLPMGVHNLSGRLAAFIGADAECPNALAMFYPDKYSPRVSEFKLWVSSLK